VPAVHCRAYAIINLEALAHMQCIQTRSPHKFSLSLLCCHPKRKDESCRDTLDNQGDPVVDFHTLSHCHPGFSLRRANILSVAAPISYLRSILGVVLEVLAIAASLERTRAYCRQRCMRRIRSVIPCKEQQYLRITDGKLHQGHRRELDPMTS
jgi:hypothetical protein